MVTTGHATVLLSGVQQGNSKKSGYNTEEQIYMHANIDFFFYSPPEYFTVVITGEP